MLTAPVPDKRHVPRVYYFKLQQINNKNKQPNLKRGQRFELTTHRRNYALVYKIMKKNTVAFVASDGQSGMGTRRDFLREEGRR